MSYNIFLNEIASSLVSAAQELEKQSKNGRPRCSRETEVTIGLKIPMEYMQTLTRDFREEEKILLIRYLPEHDALLLQGEGKYNEQEAKYYLFEEGNLPYISSPYREMAQDSYGLYWFGPYVEFKLKKRGILSKTF